MGRARFERDVERRAFDAMAALFRVGDGMHLGVRRARAQMKAFADDFSSAHEHRADARIRKSQARAELRQFQRAAEKAIIGRHNSNCSDGL